MYSTTSPLCSNKAELVYLTGVRGEVFECHFYVPSRWACTLLISSAILRSDNNLSVHSRFRLFIVYNMVFPF